MRDLTTVIRQMLVHVPEDNNLQHDFKSILSSIPYSPPESWLCWERANIAIQETIGEYPTEAWQYDLLSIWTMKTVDFLKNGIKNKKEVK